MKDIIRNMLDKAYEDKDLDLASIASDLIGELGGTYNCPSNWRSIPDELAEEYKDNKWIMNAVYELSAYSNDEED